MTLRISVVNPDRRRLALRLLFAQFPLEEQPSRLEDALRSSERGTLNLDGLLLAEEGEQRGRARHLCRADVIKPGVRQRLARARPLGGIERQQLRKQVQALRVQAGDQLGEGRGDGW